jgi:short-subunit dehydrogenase
VRTALITGASRGIGQGIAFELARQGFGLTISARSPADLDALAGGLAQAGAGKVVRYAADLTDRTALPALVEQHQETFASMDA